MTPAECPREQDVLDALAARRWPSRCDADLLAHVARCGICADMIMVIQPLADAHEELWPAIQVPSAATVWWRAQLRARQEAARRASRPMTIVQVAASIAALAVLVSIGYVASPLLASLSFSLATLPFAFSLPLMDFSLPEVPAVRELGLWSWMAIGVFVTWAVVTPLAIYFASAEE